MPKIMIACDVASKRELEQLLQIFEGMPQPCLKIGMELFYKEGPELIKKLKQDGYEIFLDLKLHDIPMTVKKALHSLSQLQVDYITIHAAGGSEMMRYASEAVKGTKTKLLAVTILTSLGQEQVTNELKLCGDIQSVAQQYAKMAYNAGIDGCICSAFEVESIKSNTGKGFLCITPGIRTGDTDGSDQKRIATPEFARDVGSDGLVIGRMLTLAEHPKAVYEQLLLLENER